MVGVVSNCTFGQFLGCNAFLRGRRSLVSRELDCRVGGHFTGPD